MDLLAHVVVTKQTVGMISHKRCFFVTGGMLDTVKLFQGPGFAPFLLSYVTGKTPQECESSAVLTNWRIIETTIDNIIGVDFNCPSDWYAPLSPPQANISILGCRPRAVAHFLGRVSTDLPEKYWPVTFVVEHAAGKQVLPCILEISQTRVGVELLVIKAMPETDLIPLEWYIFPLTFKSKQSAFLPSAIFLNVAGDRGLQIVYSKDGIHYKTLQISRTCVSGSNPIKLDATQYNVNLDQLSRMINAGDIRDHVITKFDAWPVPI